jgi:hypothetical protein
MVAWAVLCLASRAASSVQAIELQQQQQQQAKTPPQAALRYGLKFQNELDNSTAIKHLAQQQVFKCQVRLAPLAKATTAANSSQARRLKSSSSWLTSESAQRKYSKLISESHDDQLIRMLLSAELVGQQPQQQQRQQLINVTHFSIDWLKDGQSLREALGTESMAIINVTLKTQQRNADKTSFRANKARVEIKNTLNGQQMKLTSRLRLGQLKASDSGQYKCVARAEFLQQMPDRPGQQASALRLVEFVEQSLESSAANLVVVATEGGGELASVDQSQHKPPKKQQQQTHASKDPAADSASG